MPDAEGNNHSRSAGRVEKLLYTVREAAEKLSLGRATVYELLARGELRAVHIGRATRIPAAELERFVQRLVTAEGGGESHPACESDHHADHQSDHQWRRRPWTANQRERQM